MVEQWRGARAMSAVLDFTDKNHVVALYIAAAIEALERGHCACQQGRAAKPFDKIHISKAVHPTGGKKLCQRLLVGCQDVDGVVAARAKRIHRRGRLRQAPEHQWWRERHRVEGIGRQADQVAFAGTRGDDRYPSGKHAQGSAKFSAGEMRGACASTGGGQGHGRKFNRKRI